MPDEANGHGEVIADSAAMCATAALFLLMTYMHGQRRKYLGKGRKSSSSSSSSRVAPTASTPEKRAPHDITSRVSETNVLENTATQTPARSTRSRTRKWQ